MVVLRQLSGHVCPAATALLLFAASANAQPHGPVQTLLGVRVTESPRIDGRLDDAAWREVGAATEFTQRDPNEGQPATERTELRIVYDASAVYVGVRLFDREPDKIVRRLSRRDDSPDADRFSIYFDPHHDHLTGAMFSVSAAGSLSDEIIFNDSWNDRSWDAVWEAAVTIDAEGWSAEMRIPFSQLRFPTSERDAWGVNAQRYIQRRNEEAWLQLVPKKENGLASRMAHLTGIRGIDPPRQFEVMPYTVGRAEYIAPELAGNPFNDGSRAFAGTGIDLKYGLTSNFTINAAINPDFGQVEVDPAIVNLTAFETFFSERRPFFIEGSQILGNFGRGGANSFWGFNNAEPLIFYSRRVGRPPQGPSDGLFADRPPASTILGAVKLTGKSRSGWNVGLLEAVTAREFARLAGGERDRVEIEPLTNYFVARVQREVGRVGFGLLTTRVDRDLSDPALENLLPRRAWVLGGDAHLFLDRKRDWVITGMLAGSRVSGSPAAVTRAQRASQRYFQRPDALRLDPGATSMSGWTGRINLNRNSGNWRVNAALWGVSPGFESGDLGFTFRAGVAGFHSVFLWRKPTPDRFTRERNAWVAKWWTWDANGLVQGDGVQAFAFAKFLNYWEAGLNVGFRRRANDSWLTRGGPSMTAPAGGSAGGFAATDSRKRVSVEVSPFYSWNEYGGWGSGAYVGLTVRPTSSIRVSLGPEYSRSHSLAQYVSAVDDATAIPTFGTRYVFSDLDQTEFSMSARATWVMSPQMSLQLYSQPLLAVGDYWNIKELAAPRTFDFRPYAGQVDNPDFNFKSLKVNAVFRWEWRLGSTLYVVWTEQRDDFRDPGTFAFGRDARALLGAPPDDVLLVKVSYWLSR
jgi:hypothetical protein